MAIHIQQALWVSGLYFRRLKLFGETMSLFAIVRFVSAPMIVCALFSATAASDTTTFKVNSYLPEKLVDFEWEVDGGVGLTGDHRDDSSLEIEGPFSEVETGEYNEDRQVGSLSSSVAYLRQSIQRHLLARLSLSISFDNRKYSSASWESVDGGTKDRDGGSEEFGYRVSLMPGIELREYFFGDVFGKLRLNYRCAYEETPRNKAYSNSFSAGVDSTGWTEERFSKWTGDTDSDSKSHYLDAEFTVGWGRTYDGRFAATALNIVGELREAGLLLREPRYDEMRLLTERIHQYRESFWIDSRLHRMEALETIVSFLLDSGIMSESVAVGQYLIQDVWDYFPDQDDRRFGLTASAGVGIDYRYSSRQESSNWDVYEWTIRDSAGTIDTVQFSDYISHRSTYSKRVERLPYLVGVVEYARPLGLRWHLSAAAEVTWSFSEQEEYIIYARNETIDRDSEYHVAASVAAEYFHNARTSLLFRCTYWSTDQWRFSYHRVMSLPGSMPRGYYENLMFRSEIKYRISVPTTFRVISFIRFGHPSSWDTNEDGMDYYLQATLEHHIF